MRADKLIEFFGDIVTVTVGNPYTGKQLTEEELDRISDRFLVAVFTEKARMYAASNPSPENPSPAPSA